MNNDPKSPGYVETEVEAAKRAVLAVYPKSVLLHNETWGWGVFFNGKPRMNAKGEQTSPDVIVRLKKEAWPAAAFQLMRKVADSKPNPHPPIIDTTLEEDRECPSCGGQGLIGDFVGLEMRCVGVECDRCKGTGRIAK